MQRVPIAKQAENEIARAIYLIAQVHCARTLKVTRVNLARAQRAYKEQRFARSNMFARNLTLYIEQRLHNA
jgi:hypothetical protein